ncbi:hypothetical protein [Paractinoplanes ovalisporus]|nr:hypothetical protein [Actinoplanes ovalisporus]
MITLYALGESTHTGELMLAAFTVLLAVVAVLIAWVVRTDRPQ